MGDKFILSEKFRLELHWKEIKYEAEERCKLIDACFSGPVLSIAQKIEENSFIDLDFYEQYSIITKNYYVARFSWNKVIYNKDNTVSLGDAYLSHNKDLNKVPKLKNNDFIVIDTKGHEEETHAFNLVYRSYVVNENFIMYNFRK